MQQSTKQPLRKMKLSAFMAYDGNYNMSAWRQSDAYTDAGWNINRWIECAKILERGKFDMLFIADFITPHGSSDIPAMSQNARAAGFEPLTLLSALSTATSRLGLAGTVSTTWNQPYTVARMLASLDHLSAGRSGWNIVTSRNPDDALNYNQTDHMEHDLRYERAEEFVDVVKGLWDTFEDDAIVVDKAEGRFFDPQKFHLLNHKGNHFKVRGPLGVKRPVQGYPVRIVAGDSEPGKQLAGRVADVIFTMHATMKSAQTFYSDIQSRAAAFGRGPNNVKILPGATIYVAKTRSEAEDKFNRILELMPANVAIRQLSILMGMDLSQYPLDGPVPEIPPSAMRVNPVEFLAHAREGQLTLLQTAQRATAGKSHFMIIGSAIDVADQLEEWFRNDAADGFNLLPPMIPGSLSDFVDLVVPELRRRGLFRTDYEGVTLRENLGLSRPANSYSLNTAQPAAEHARP